MLSCSAISCSSPMLLDLIAVMSTTCSDIRWTPAAHRAGAAASAGMFSQVQGKENQGGGAPRLEPIGRCVLGSKPNLTPATPPRKNKHLASASVRRAEAAV